MYTLLSTETQYIQTQKPYSTHVKNTRYLLVTFILIPEREAEVGLFKYEIFKYATGILSILMKAPVEVGNLCVGSIIVKVTEEVGETEAEDRVMLILRVDRSAIF